ncbi:MAG: hypothetical protein ACRDT6_02025 [Micromonosporaceae bacterium]
MPPVRAPGGGIPNPFDGAGIVDDALDSLLRGVAADASNSVLGALASVVLITPDVTEFARVRAVWTASMVAVDIVFVLVLILGGATAMGYETVQFGYEWKELLGRSIVALLAAHLSLPLCQAMITLANAVTLTLADELLTSAVDELSKLLTESLATSGWTMVLLTLVFAVGAFAVIFTAIVRIVLVIVLVAAAPLALACHALPFTEPLALWWWKALSACLGAQIGQAVAVAAAAPILLSAAPRSVFGQIGDALLKLLCAIILVWLLFKIPVWALRSVRSSGGSLGPLRLLKYALAHHVAGRVFDKVGLRRRNRRDGKARPVRNSGMGNVTWSRRIGGPFPTRTAAQRSSQHAADRARRKEQPDTAGPDRPTRAAPRRGQATADADTQRSRRSEPGSKRERPRTVGGQVATPASMPKRRPQHPTRPAGTPAGWKTVGGSAGSRRAGTAGQPNPAGRQTASAAHPLAPRTGQPRMSKSPPPPPPNPARRDGPDRKEPRR